MVLKYLIEKEFKQIIRNPIIPRLILAYPVLMFGLFPWAVTFEIHNIELAVVDEAKDEYSKRLCGKISASSYFSVQDAKNYDEALAKMEADKADIILHIPNNFSRDLVKADIPTLFFAVNAVDAPRGLLGANYLSKIVQAFSTELQMEQPSVEMLRIPKMEIITNYRYNPHLDYKTYVLPGFIALLITLICGLMPTLSTVLEKEKGTMQQINATPVKKAEFVVAKLIPYWVIGIILLTVSVFLMWLIYGLVPQSSWWEVYVVVILYIMAVSGLGILISNYSENMQQAMFLAMFIILILILLSGLFTAVSAMPCWAQVIAYANPLTYFIELLRALYLKGSSLCELWEAMTMIGVFLIILNGLAILSHRKTH